ncbi:hypothetical protein FHS43_005474 [Streptosporangium becharense]|uniref:Uncharacterized protein n=1 Tax=Streptosporangium becharense TaxID=1816182 RepID=A0A7W9IAM9_9ACTN|nr:hypothetical protein [Streptosporangium becharense]MBB2914162.1 hypothetical protein [Streptosporangium becharense]MBB5817189.1 hypothetical protein [Streptosporangium becharense]
MNVVSRLLKICGIIAMILGSVWFVLSCGTSLSGDMCGARSIRPGMVCVDEAGRERTYEQMITAKEGGPAQMTVGGAIFAGGVVLNVLSGVMSRRARAGRRQAT